MSAKIKKIGNSGRVKLDETNLKALIKHANERRVVRVGVLGGKASAQHGESELTNAQVGLIHEKGSKSNNIPRRSWLEVPLQDHLSEYFQKLGAKLIKDMLVNQPQKAFEQLGLVCEQIILKGFETNGFGKWAPLKAATIARKGSDRILVDTGQLKKSVTSEVVNK